MRTLSTGRSQELKLIRASGMKRFPRLFPEQPIFYPVLNREYAQQIAQQWNTKDSAGQLTQVGFVTAFDLSIEYLKRFNVGSVARFIENCGCLPRNWMSSTRRFRVESK